MQDYSEELEKFLLVLSLCHTVIPEVEDGQVVYHASSPDEEALVKAVKELGVVFKARTPDGVVIDVVRAYAILVGKGSHCSDLVCVQHGKEEKYEVLNLLEFNR